MALAKELKRREVAAEFEVELPVAYKGELLDCMYRVDCICFGEVLVELKAQSSTGGPEAAQVLNYLKASSMDVALLLNFGTPRLVVERFSKFTQPNSTSESSVTSVDG